MPDTKRPSAELGDPPIPGAYPESSGPSTSTQQSLTHALYARRSEFTRTKQIRVKVGTWNVAALKHVELDLGAWFVSGKGITERLAGLDVNPKADEERESVGAQEASWSDEEITIPKNDIKVLPADDDIGLYVLGLQEVVDISSPTEALRPFTDPSVGIRWKGVLEEALPPGYKFIAQQQLVGILLLIYAAPSVAAEIGSVSTTMTGTGLMGYMGNKGAVAARLVLGETTKLLFVNCHLAAGTEKGACDRRNWDANQIISRSKFEPLVDPFGVALATGDRIGDEDFGFWFGDLNYRLEGMPGDDVRRLLELHVRNEYNVGRYQASAIDLDAVADALERAKDTIADDNSSQSSGTTAVEPAEDDDFSDRGDITPSADPASLVTTISSLLPHDELHQQIKARKAFYDGWREGPIRFLPTYKYDVGSAGVFDSSEKRRSPSWCDRILFRTRNDKLSYEKRLKDEEEARKRDAELKAEGVDQASDEEDILFDYDPAQDGMEGDDYDEYGDADPVSTATAENFEDDIIQEYYTSHQRVLSSDHKPLNSVFVLKYESVIPELKAQVYAEVARELDRTENETRPTVTLIVDQPMSSSDKGGTDSAAVDFGPVRYADSINRTLIAANTGQVPANICFLDRPNELGITPPWLSVNIDHPLGVADKFSYTLQPGETLSIQLTLQILGVDFIRRLNSGDEDISDILVLRITGGRDHFIPIRGQWQATCLGRSIADLIRIPEGGIRSLQQKKESIKPTSSGIHFSAPRELFKLSESLEHTVERCVAEWDMTVAQDQPDNKPPWEKNAGWPFAEDSWEYNDTQERLRLECEIIDALDNDRSVDSAIPSETPTSVKTEVLAECVLHFLRYLTDGIIPSDLWSKLEADLIAREKSKVKSNSIDDQTSAVLEVLSTQPNHSISFVIVTSMLSRIIHELTTVSAEKAKSRVAVPETPRAANVRRRTLSKVPLVARRQIVEKSISSVLAPEVVKLPTDAKSRNAAQDRAAGVIELFVKDERA